VVDEILNDSNQSICDEDDLYFIVDPLLSLSLSLTLSFLYPLSLSFILCLDLRCLVECVLIPAKWSSF